MTEKRYNLTPIHYSNEKYADVMLFSSKDEEKASLEELDSCGIPAHKAILSTSSQVSDGYWLGDGRLCAY